MCKGSKFESLAKMFKYIWVAICLQTVFAISAEVSICGDVECVVPTRNVEIEGNTIIVTYDFPEVKEVSISTEESNILYHSIPGFGQCNEVGKPLLPMRIDTFRIPYGYDVSISVVTSDCKSLNCSYVGVAEPLTDSSMVSETYSMATSSSGIYPKEVSSILRTYSMRGETLAEVVVSPIQYDYENNLAMINGRVEYKLTFTPKTSIISETYDMNDVDGIVGQNDEYLDEYLSHSLVENANEIGKVEVEGDDTDGCEKVIGYIIVTTDRYLTAVEQFVLWKKILGYTTHVISKSKWTNPEEVLSAVRDCREANNNIQYLIIIGDHTDVPAMRSNRIAEHITDSYFGFPKSGGLIPDIYIGRVPVNNSTEAYNIITKLIRAEMCPTMGDEFYKNSVHCSKFDIGSAGTNIEDRRFVLTSEEIRDYVSTKGIRAHRFYSVDSNANPQFYSNYYSFGQPIPAELQRPSFEWKCSPADIVNKINEGCLYALYRAHGLMSGWYGVGFYSSSLSQLNNYEMYPTVFSITCKTGNFEGNCFAEQLLKIPEAGASAVIASSEVSYSGYNDSLAEGIIDAIWPNPGLLPRFNKSTIGSVTKTPTPTYRLGQILEQGLFRMNEQWGTVSKNTVLYQYEVFHLFGDPSMYFFTENPKSFSNVDIIRDDNGIRVSTHGEIASISFYNRVSDMAYRYETDEVYFPTDDPGNTIVCLTGHNRLTCIDGMFNTESTETEAMPDVMYCMQRGNSTSIVNFVKGDVDSLILSVSDITGRCIYSTPVEKGTNITEVELPISEARGVYVMTLCADGIIVDTKKILK